jgi:hypothetical protein
MTTRQTTCKCGLRIVVNDDAFEVSHELPECEWFTSLVAQAGPRHSKVEFIDPDTGRKLKAGVA